MSRLGRRSSLELLVRVDDNLDVSHGKVPGLSIDAPLQPVLVDVTEQPDGVALLECQLSGVLGLEVVEGFALGLANEFRI